MIGEIAAELLFAIFENVAEGLFDEAGLIGEGDDADYGGLPIIVMFEFGHGDVEFVSEAVFEAAQDLALVFEGVGVWDADIES
jgi:hypothetical protein